MVLRSPKSVLVDTVSQKTRFYIIFPNRPTAQSNCVGILSEVQRFGRCGDSDANIPTLRMCSLPNGVGH